MPWRVDGKRCLSEHELYEDAKRKGDVRAALKVIEDSVDWDQLDLIVDFHRDRSGRLPSLVAPSLAEGGGVNALPVAYSAFLAKELGFPRCDTLFQHQGVKRDLKGGWFRFANKALLFGEIQPDHTYIIADDVCTLGGTIAETRSFIEGLGGHVVGATCLASATGHNVQLALTDKTSYELATKFGDPLRDFWKEEFGYDTDCLTDPEASYLVRNGVNVDGIRDAIHRQRDG
jgi:hypothetical protein